MPSHVIQLSQLRTGHRQLLEGELVASSVTAWSAALPEATGPGFKPPLVHPTPSCSLLTRQRPSVVLEEARRQIELPGRPSGDLRKAPVTHGLLNTTWTARHSNNGLSWFCFGPFSPA